MSIIPVYGKVTQRTGMPQEQDIPAPVTTSILLLFATERDMSERERLADASVGISARSRVTVILLMMM